MSTKKNSPPILRFAMFVILAILLFLTPEKVFAKSDLQSDDGSQCVTCHEDLYYLHDTGKWYCLKETPMECIQCHGGNPNTLVKEDAHFDRSAHPVINENDKKCYECHPSEAETRLGEFRQFAGIAEVKVAIPYQPGYAVTKSQSGEWVLGLETITVAILVALALTVLIISKIRHG